MSQTVYIVVQQGYDDSEICSATLSKEVADAVCAEIGVDTSVEEWQLDDVVPAFYRYEAYISVHDADKELNLDYLHNGDPGQPRVGKIRSLRADMVRSAELVMLSGRPAGVRSGDYRNYRQSLAVLGRGPDAETAIANAQAYRVAALAGNLHPDDAQQPWIRSKLGIKKS